MHIHTLHSLQTWSQMQGCSWDSIPSCTARQLWLVKVANTFFSTDSQGEQRASSPCTSSCKFSPMALRILSFFSSYSAISAGDSTLAAAWPYRVMKLRGETKEPLRQWGVRKDRKQGTQQQIDMIDNKVMVIHKLSSWATTLINPSVG